MSFLNGVGVAVTSVGVAACTYVMQIETGDHAPLIEDGPTDSYYLIT